ncbi:hypothetical protein AB833_17240 [Chromatiales bacterium (ex Bugula neritina AB1)]|nr:hypothetical protein AB833_17240 [Chromatiales bacterium (ex Bugula neritina AB1)]
MARKQMQRDNPDIDFEDLEEVPRRVRESRVKAGIIGVFSFVFLLALTIILIRGSMPDMTPEQIVQMQGYEGQQAPRHIFNLYSLKQQRESASAASGGSVLPRESRVIDSDAEVVVLNSQPLSAETGRTAAGDENNASENSPGGLEAAVEPAVLYEGAELARVPDIRLIRHIDAAGKTNDNSEESVQLGALPVLIVKGDQSLLRSGPSRQKDVLKTLSKGDTITVFNHEGDWVYVGTNDGSSIVGYMHISLFEPE